MIAHLSYVRCDICGDPAQPADDAQEARQLAKREGYVQRDGRDFCRDCHAALADPVPVGSLPVPCEVILQPLGEPLDCVFYVHDRVTRDPGLVRLVDDRTPPRHYDVRWDARLALRWPRRQARP